ncbi:EmrB/QacA subfamily drug resistance transporter [Aeromicrobium panaciterrae]|uniref:EmrB/QacA subfamily drug resistance transporter n=1 Tax=Aeromicrobium panaciterrae TaxID=363861 RepID=A0ABU1ULR1_9ACTN|nr:MDR family MFS transporter [Aeromicrobium panaciterrae]MDR7086133.1 EmrB/QacA subfamily drug resistance transporter [Aeromicrobium panaciterrae]
MTDTQTSTEPVYFSHRQILVILAGLMTGMFLAALDQSIVGTALPRITSELHGLNKLSWVVTAYLLASTAATPLWGKISDLYGRRLIFQAAIITFLVGSLLCGFASNIDQLIAFRALQGIGGGGLMALALATLGDVIPPRERGRYMGYMGAVFGSASVLGPVLGGTLADGPGWEWIFWLNVPIGIVALVVTSYVLKLPHVRREHTIDWLGAAVLVSAVSSVLLYTAWAGPEHGWLDSMSLSLLGGGLLLAVFFILIERRASEPILPMELFNNSVFSITNALGMVFGIAMFGAIIFVPLYLQIVMGMSPTKSGLGMVPMVAGMFSASIPTGNYVSKTGHYRFFPIASTIFVAGALLLLSTLDADSSYLNVGIGMFALGFGLGLTMQLLTLIVQNSVDVRHMGVATSTVTFFRNLGGAFGTAVFGAVLNSRLAHHLETSFGPGAGTSVNTNDATAIRHLPEPVRVKVIDAFALSLHEVFLTALPFVGIAFILALFIKELPLRSRSTPMPAEATEL